VDALTDFDPAPAAYREELRKNWICFVLVPPSASEKESRRAVGAKVRP
jgi:hypothetical protein